MSSNGTKNVHHIIPFKYYYGVWVSLIVFTVITVLASYVDLGSAWNIFIALLIATAKAMMVMLIFMGLKWDDQENNVTFFSSFLFLAIFIGLTSTDLFYREPSRPVKVDKSELQASGEPVDFKALSTPSDELMAKGKGIYNAQCMMCHGAAGKGDGPASAALNPKPRDFTNPADWKNKRTMAGVMKTLTDGVGSMPAFSVLSVKDRFALVHVVREMMGSAPKDSAAELAAMEKAFGGGPKKKLPLDFTIDRMAK